MLTFIGAGSAFSQRHEMGLWLGGANYFGDLNTQTKFKLVQPATGLFYRYNFDQRLSLRLNLDAGRVFADDRYSGIYYERVRNLRFFSYIEEVSTQFEFNFMNFSTTDSKSWFTPYLFAGFAVFHFKPKANYDGIIYDLRSLGTEGQGYLQYPDLHPYKVLSTAKLLGGGFKFRIEQNLGAQVEAGIRKTHTDYLDDVSGVYANNLVLLNEGGPDAAYLADPSGDIVGEAIGAPFKMRGDASKRDDYFFFGIGIFYTLNPYKCPLTPIN